MRPPPRDPVDHALLRAFLAVVEHGSFTGAARALRVPKSTLSKRVAALEARVGGALLTRTTRAVQVTAAGRAMATDLRAALAAVDDAVARAEDVGARPRGQVRVTAPVVFGDELLAPLIAPFLARHPEVTIDLALVDRRVDLVAEGVDVAIRAGPLVDSSLLVRRLGPAEACVVASPSYLRRRPAPRRVTDLQQHPWCVFYTGDSPPPTAVLRGPRGEVRLTTAAVVTTTSQLALRRCLLDGVGVGLLPWYLARGAVERGALVEILPQLRGRAGELQLLTATTRPGGAVRAFVDAVLDAFRDDRPWVRAPR